MISALALLLLPQGAAKLPEPTFEQILEAANKAWYELPAATTSLGLLEEGGLRVTEYRDGSNFVFQMNEHGETQLQMRSNGIDEFVLIPPQRQYKVAPATPRPSWSERELEPETDVQANKVRFEMSRDRGLVLRVPGHTFRVIRDVPVKPKSGEGETRFVAAEIKRPATDTVPAGSIVFQARLDVKLGFIRVATLTVSNPDKPDEPRKLFWQCDPKAHPAADYSVDMARFKGWTKIEGGTP